MHLNALELRWDRVSRQRTDLQDDATWPAPVNPHGRGSSRERWTGLKGGLGWVLLLVETETTKEARNEG